MDMSYDAALNQQYNPTRMRQIDLQLPSPKRDRSSSTGRAGWYPYYAGFSAGFAGAIMDRFCTKQDARILDSWNGSGTTTAVAASRGIESFGFDLNPVMSIVARARLLSKRERSSLISLARAINSLAPKVSFDQSDALATWFKPATVTTIRSIESAIQRLFFGDDRLTMATHMQERPFSDLAAFFYVALFRTVRGLLSTLQSSNPTWMKRPKCAADRIQLPRNLIFDEFLANAVLMEAALDADAFEMDGKVHIQVAASANIPMASNSIDFVLTSPPYCTRIDYAAATRIELAILGISDGEPFESLRRKLMGTTTVPRIAPVRKDSWGTLCNEFLQAVESHSSRASAVYYLKGHCQYFDGLQASVNELHRCLKTSGQVCMVVQDSFYKDIHIDLAGICIEMAQPLGMELSFRQDFIQSRNRAQAHPNAKPYRNSAQATESVLVLTKH